MVSSSGMTLSKPGQRHVGAGHGVEAAHDVLAEAGHFHAVRHGVAGEAGDVLEGHRSGIEALGHGPAEHERNPAAAMPEPAPHST